MDTSNYISVGAAVVSATSAALTWWKARAAWNSAQSAQAALELQRSNLLLQIEGRIADAEAGVEEAIGEMEDASVKGDTRALDHRRAVFERRKAHYFNQLDRLAAETLKGNFDLAQVHREYRDVFRNVIRAYPDHFQAATEYRDILLLHERFEKTLDNLPSSLPNTPKKSPPSTTAN